MDEQLEYLITAYINGYFTPHLERGVTMKEICKDLKLRPKTARRIMFRLCGRNELYYRIYNNEVHYKIPATKAWAA